MTTGTVETDNPSDCLYLEYELVPADRLHSAKRQILESLGFLAKETFPIYKERIPSQLLSFLRLSRVQDTSQLSQVSQFGLDVSFKKLVLRCDSAGQFHRGRGYQSNERVRSTAACPGRLQSSPEWLPRQHRSRLEVLAKRRSI